MYAPRASASTSSGWAYSRSIRSRTRRSHARSRRCCAAAGLLVTCAIMPRRTGVRWIARAPAATQAAACRASSSTDTGVAGWSAFVLSPLSAACSPTLVSIMATSCLANVGLRGGRVALIPARVILRRRGCLASRKASPRSGAGGQPFFDATHPRACCDGDHYADNAGLDMGRRHRGKVWSILLLRGWVNKLLWAYSRAVDLRIRRAERPPQLPLQTRGLPPHTLRRIARLF